MDYVFGATLRHPGTPRRIEARAIRSGSIRAARRVLPGALIHFDGRWSMRYQKPELHILRIRDIRPATLPENYRPTDRPDGTWQWRAYNGTPAS